MNVVILVALDVILPSAVSSSRADQEMDSIPPGSELIFLFVFLDPTGPWTPKSPWLTLLKLNLKWLDEFKVSKPKILSSCNHVCCHSRL